MALLLLIQHKHPEKVGRSAEPKSWCCEGSQNWRRPGHNTAERKRGHSMRWRKQLNFSARKKMQFEGVPHKAYSAFFCFLLLAVACRLADYHFFAHKTYIIATFECCFLFFKWKTALKDFWSWFDIGHWYLLVWPMRFFTWLLRQLRGSLIEVKIWGICFSLTKIQRKICCAAV